MQSLYKTQKLLDVNCFSAHYDSEEEEELDTASYSSLNHNSSPRLAHKPGLALPPFPTPLLAPHHSATAAIARRPNPNHSPGLRVLNPTYPLSIIPPTDLVPLPEASIPTDRLNYALRKEMVGNTLNTNSNFLEHLLPHERLPFPVDEDLLRKLSAPIGSNAPIWNGVRSCFRQSPTNFGQAAICNWLNNIGTTMGLVNGRQCERLWWSGNVEVPLQLGPSKQRKQCLVLLDRSYRAQRGHISDTQWAFVKALVEVHQSPNARLTHTISIATYLTFLCQPHRRFTISLSFINTENGQFTIKVTDRAGQIRVNNIDVMGCSIENGLLLLSILAFLMFGSPEDIGLDPHFEINPLDGQVVAIECENRRFEVVKRIHASQSLFGRGTQVWIVVHNGAKYILKDSWVRDDRIHNEVAYLCRMKDHKGLEGHVPTLVHGGDVVINGIKDSTRRYRSATFTHLIHRRIVTSPVGQPITSFKSKKEFIQVMIGIIETHRYLYDHVRILHCDLSVDNVLLNREDNESKAVGLLIDYDYSIEADSEAKNEQDVQLTAGSASDTRAAEDPPIGETIADAPLDPSGQSAAVRASHSLTPRMGTPPYMAIEALLNPIFVHKPQHDLESILYIILCICTFVHGPGRSLYESDIARVSPPIRSWFSKDGIKEIGSRKLAHLEYYDVTILPYFAPYWRDFTPFIRDLIMACFPVKPHLPNELQYEQVLGILKKAYDAVEEPVNPTVPRVDPQALKRPSSSPAPCRRDTKKGKCSSL